ncbi:MULTISPECIES: DUF2388 domain-containing protein [Pseudomonas]|uniref:Holliday junction resolvasome, helicase subunit n=1 Tax=Pseudomonas migulae TaxID=78543 RepID=A0A1H5JYH7_9PSED|nr:MULTISPECIES: DUF2388 domain-containing protein [Pseudomonas]TWC56160.1 uncharacterized protein (TIGR02448 family) [Pseudomonas sp. SJZ080]SEE57625.1 conserverd hypothetical protein [Pseudomonas migulae]
MKSTRLIVLITGLLSSGAQATSFVISTDITLSLTLSSTKGTSGSFKDDKIVLAAKDDAAAFVASEGEIRGARIEAAFESIRGGLSDQYSDQQLATAILML